MKLKLIVSVSLIAFVTSVVILLTVGLLLTPPPTAAISYVTDPVTGASVAVDAGTGQPVADPAVPGSTVPPGTSGQTSLPARSNAPGASGQPQPGTSTAPGHTPTPVPGGSRTPVPPITPAPTPTRTPVQTPPPTPAPTPVPPACGAAGGVCSPAQVATHNSQTNCWVIYASYYYNVTGYVNAHPGGRASFNSATCGHDITAYLNGSAASGGGQHAHSASAYNTLTSYRVGPVR